MAATILVPMGCYRIRWVFFFMRRFLNKNALWLETFTHELTHIVVAMLFLRKVHSFHAEEGFGVVYTSGQSNNMIPPMALAPYCLPIYTFLLLSVRCLNELSRNVDI